MSVYSAATATASPRPSSIPQADEPPLPSGQCRFLLLVPELRGQRCGCANFHLNKTTPSATCHCGHLACYHVMNADCPSDKEEIELLRYQIRALEEEKSERLLLSERLQALEEHRQGPRDILVRVSELEEAVERSREEVGQEIKASYRNLNRAWHSISELTQRTERHDEVLRCLEGRVRDTEEEVRRLGQRQLELVDADISLEERLEELEEIMDGEPDPSPEDRRRTSSPKSKQPATVLVSASRGQSSSSRVTSSAREAPPASAAMPLRLAPAPNDTASRASPWTVHISLLPSSSRPFPYERGTVAYNRCLSRGLHQMVAVNGHDACAFVIAVSETFGSLLSGRPWVPLQAEICNAETLRGLPMLRRLDASLVDATYDFEFLRRYCAVHDDRGRIDSLYIAPRDKSLSWSFLRHSPVWMPGLETCWDYEPLLDENDLFEEEDEPDEPCRQPTGRVLEVVPSLKRGASEMSRSSSLSSVVAGVAGEAEGPSTKAPCLINVAEVNNRRAEKV